MWIRLVMCLCFSLLCSIGESSAKSQEKFALLIGNHEYKEVVGKLTNPGKDVSLVGTSLTKLGFKVTKLEDLGYSEMEKAIQRYAKTVKSAGENTVSLFYYSGHGAADASSGINYIIPVDVATADDETLWDSSIDVQKGVIDRLQQMAPKAEHILILDACRNELRLVSVSKGLGNKGFVSMDVPGLLVAYSTAARRTASDLGINGGIYAKALSEQLLEPNLEIAQVFRAVGWRVMASLGQQPFFSVGAALPAIYLSGSDKNRAPSSLPPDSTTSREVGFERERASSIAALESVGDVKALLQQLTDEHVAAGGSFVGSAKWPQQSDLKICFLDGSAQLQTYVASIAKQWTLYGNLKFDFGEGDVLRECQKADGSVIRITFEQMGNWSYIGTEGLNIPDGSPTMSLESIGGDGCKIHSGKCDQAILHEFGHAIGYDHGWTAPNSGCDAEMDWAYIYKDLHAKSGLDSSEVDRMLRVPASGQQTVGAFDKRSVMNYDLPPEYFKGGVSSKCYAEPLNGLSLRDKLATYVNYP